eukprot:CAMPEP_0114131442 /NCGR_PEP_ID=MMETSP0043_2-20121206/12555_1 /TAXON_ID=464988 /ORGANISM="Hemiselmis andersenii, Strain CCMP644" /LENGTH=31 /DNA_ID= /DNA_START= /DNA_END= /DNA_ORIENTATION=
MRAEAQTQDGGGGEQREGAEVDSAPTRTSLV